MQLECNSYQEGSIATGILTTPNTPLSSLPSVSKRKEKKVEKDIFLTKKCFFLGLNCLPGMESHKKIKRKVMKRYVYWERKPFLGESIST